MRLGVRQWYHSRAGVPPKWVGLRGPIEVTGARREASVVVLACFMISHDLRTKRLFHSQPLPRLRDPACLADRSLRPSVILSVKTVWVK